jgi:phage shock protein A
MNLFRRISDILEANFNTLLDRLEDPAAMVAQVLREMEDGVVEARGYAAAAIAAERQLARELAQQRREAEHWQARARQALAAGREDLARQALVRKAEHEDLGGTVEAQAAAARRATDQVKADLRTLEGRLAEARQRQRTLLARHRAAAAHKDLNRCAGVGLLSPGNPGVRFERLEDRLTQLEEELEAQEVVQQSRDELQRELGELEAGHAIDRELEALKREMGGGE